MLVENKTCRDEAISQPILLRRTRARLYRDNVSLKRLGMGDVRGSLCGERAALNQGGETGIGSKFVPFRIHVKEREVHIVNVQGVVQPVQRCFRLPKASVQVSGAPGSTVVPSHGSPANLAGI